MRNEETHSSHWQLTLSVIQTQNCCCFTECGKDLVPVSFWANCKPRRNWYSDLWKSGRLFRLPPLFAHGCVFGRISYLSPWDILHFTHSLSLRVIKYYLKNLIRPQNLRDGQWVRLVEESTGQVSIGGLWGEGMLAFGAPEIPSNADTDASL